jgi:hypothetical protein
MISTPYIMDSMLHYLSCGYSPVDCPYSVSLPAINATLPVESNPQIDIGSPGNYFVGSAEQGIIQLLLDKAISPSGMYMAIGPCMRYEVKYDDLHKQLFLKLELIAFNSHYLQVLNDAKSFFDSLEVGETSIVHTSIGHDLTLNGIEIGSYGHRVVSSDIHFSYGTGIAEPRLSQAIARKC